MDPRGVNTIQALDPMEFKLKKNKKIIDSDLEMKSFVLKYLTTYFLPCD